MTCGPHLRTQVRPLCKPKRVAAEMIPLVVQYLQYGQSWMAFCSVHGISANQLYYWQGKCSRKSAASQGSAFLENSASDAGERVPMNVV